MKITIYSINNFVKNSDNKKSLCYYILFFHSFVIAIQIIIKQLLKISIVFFLFGLLSINGRTIHSIWHLIAHHEDTTDTHSHSDGLQFESEHHHCDFDQYTFGSFLVADYISIPTFITLKQLSHYEHYSSQLFDKSITAFGLDPPKV